MLPFACTVDDGGVRAEMPWMAVDPSPILGNGMAGQLMEAQIPNGYGTSSYLLLNRPESSSARPSLESHMPFSLLLFTCVPFNRPLKLY
jgi:hypothetical protein